MKKADTKKVKEINNFTLIYDDGLMWVEYDNFSYPIDINPYEISILMKNEGYKMEKFKEDVELKFIKSTLINTLIHYSSRFVQFESHGTQIRPLRCYVKR